MNEMQVFQNPEFGKVRTVVVNGEPWLVGKDVARALKYGEGKSLANAVQPTLSRNGPRPVVSASDKM